MKSRFLTLASATTIVTICISTITVSPSYAGSTTFSCRDNQDGSYTTIETNTPWGNDVPIVRWVLPSHYNGDWGWPPQRRCNTVAETLQLYYSNQGLEDGFTTGTVLISKEEYPVICVGTAPCGLSNLDDGRLLFMLEPGEQEYGQCVLTLLEALRFAGSAVEPVDSRASTPLPTFCTQENQIGISEE